jgi:hypothetical protein
MLSLASTPSTAALDRADPSARVGARAGAKPEATSAGTPVRETPQVVQRPAIEGAVASVADGLSTVAAIGVTVGSIPAALCRMRDIAVASNSGTLSETERAKLRSEYMDLNLQVVSAIGESGRTLAVTAPEDAASSQHRPKGGHQQADSGSGRGGEPGTGDGHPSASQAAATAEAAHPAAAATEHIEAARPAVLAQFRQQAAAPRASFSVRA